MFFRLAQDAHDGGQTNVQRVLFALRQDADFVLQEPYRAGNDAQHKPDGPDEVHVYRGSGSREGKDDLQGQRHAKRVVRMTTGHHPVLLSRVPKTKQ